MHRADTNVNDVQLEDILCDFCGDTAWANGTPCVEGHRGSVVCGDCLSKAYRRVVLVGNTELQNTTCTMCIERRDQSLWKGSFGEGANICLRCIKQSATVLEKSEHWDWERPTKL
ncbi:MAG: hypothetical protein QGI78_02940 [Phycisphaerales bacterium]|jgi:hypothetical protein|nr:hypothetical protein [Phycisphaerales bacterium]